MSYFGKNLKKIRSVKKLSQTDFAAIFNLTRASIGAYEEERAEAKIDTLIMIAKYFSISIDSLIGKELTVNEIIHFDGLKKIPRQGFVAPIKLVSAEISAQYIQNCSNETWAGKLPVLGYENEDSVRAFVVLGSEMTVLNGGIRNGDMVIAQRVETISADKLIDNKVYVWVTAKNIIVRRLAKKNNELHLIADNSDYALLKLRIDQMVECWQVRGVYSEKINSYSTRLLNG